MSSWAAKDPSAVLDYVYRIPLDAGDSIAALGNVTFTKLSGTVTIQSTSLAAAPNTIILPDGSSSYGQDFTAWLSGGVDGETDVFKIVWATALTRTNDDIITLNVALAQIAALDLVNYGAPLPGHLQLRYPAFASVPFATIQYWLTDAQRFVGNSWRASDYPIGIMALAAHNMSVAGLAPDASQIRLGGGVNRFKMGPMDVSLTTEAANANLASDLTSTRYGVEFITLRAANRGGPLVADTGVPIDGLNPVGWLAGF